jgi:predicted nucleotidyltransferase
MPLPALDDAGELPLGVHRATLDEVIAQFGSGTAQRIAVTGRLQRIYRLAKATGKLHRFVLFGSYVTAKPEPKDVDVILIMADDFELNTCDEETRSLFEHERAAERLGASIFWTRPAILFLDTMDEFIAHWQIKRDQTRRGIVEVEP